ncbi:hypothetical protein M8C21_000104, partial [Ambrosia artemisiifolia]
ATGWKLEEAIQLFYAENEFGDDASSSPYNSSPENGSEFGDDSSSPYISSPENEVFIPDQDFRVEESHMEFEDIIEDDGSVIRAPMPVKRDVLYDTPMFYSPSHEAQHYEELKRFEVWGSVEQASTSAAETSRDNLASLYPPPFALMYHGSFQKAKEAASDQDRWLLVNVQSTKEFSSHMLNRDTWGNEAVAQTITSNFIFWQFILVCDDTEEGSKVMTYYKLDSVPATLVIDPITGQKMRLWRGMIQPENETNVDDDEMKLAQALSKGTINDISEGFLKDLGDTKELSKKEHNYPPLPEEPKGDKSLLCRVGVRLPDGSRVQRSFLRSDPIQLLWSFCAAKCGDEKPFRLTHAVPGAMKDLNYDNVLTFADAGVANSMIS